MAKLVTWSQYRDSVGDRSSLFGALTDLWPIRCALYVGSYVDLAPSTAIETVTYVDNDPRATRFFADPHLVRAELDGRTRPGAGVEVRFHTADYYQPLPVQDASVELVISLFTGPAWSTPAATCTLADGCWPTPAMATPARPPSTRASSWSVWLMRMEAGIASPLTSSRTT